jgi:hypothetical protein
MDAAVLEQALDEIFDQALVYHAFTDYTRDYEVIVYMTADHHRPGTPRTGAPNMPRRPATTPVTIGCRR